MGDVVPAKRVSIRLFNVSDLHRVMDSSKLYVLKFNSNRPCRDDGRIGRSTPSGGALVFF